MTKKTKSLESLNSTVFSLWQEATGGTIDTLEGITFLPSLESVFLPSKGKEQILAEHSKSLLAGTLSHKFSNKKTLFVYICIDENTKRIENSHLWTQWTQDIAYEKMNFKGIRKCHPNKWEVTEVPAKVPTLILTRRKIGAIVRIDESHTITGESIPEIEDKIKAILEAHYAS